MVQNVKFKKNFIWFLQIQCYHLELTISLPVFSKNALFHSARLPKMRNSTASLNTLYTAESAQLYSEFLPTTISLTGRCRRKHGDSLCFWPKTLNLIRKCVDTKTMLSFIVHFQWQRAVMLCAFIENGVIENFEYLGKFEKDFRKC